MRAAGLLAALLAAAPTAVAVAGIPVPGAEAGRYTFSGDVTAEVTAFYPDGDVLFVGRTYVAGYVVRAARYSPDMTVRRWEFISGSSVDLVRAIAIGADGTAYLLVDYAAIPYVQALTTGGGQKFFTSLGGLSGARDLKVDPATGHVWIAGAQSGAPPPYRGRLVEFLDTGSGLSVLGSSEHAGPGNTNSYAESLAITADRVYLAGRAYDNPSAGDRPWIVARDRTSPAERLNVVDPVIGAVTALQVMARGDLLYTLNGANSACTIQILSLTRYSAVTGAPLVRATVGSLPIVPPCPPGIYTGKAVLHPSLPLVVTLVNNTVKGFGEGLSEAWAFSMPDSNPSVAGIALSGEVNYRVAAVWRIGTTNPYTVAGTVKQAVVDFLTRTGNSKVLVAPNRLDLKAGSSASLVFVLREPKTADAVAIRIFDTSGRHVGTLEVPPGSEKARELRWDGMFPGGKKIGPGTYFAVADGGEFVGSTDRAPFIVTGKAKAQ